MQIIQVNSHIIFSLKDSLIIFDESTNQSQTIQLPEPKLEENTPKTKQQKIDQTINSVTCSEDGKLIALTTENKQLHLFNSQFQHLKTWLTKRVASQIIFTKNNDGILLADKTGDVLQYKLDEDNDKEPKILLGHLSIVLDLCLSECGKFLITCDRDEKIRVSHYPNTYNIATFCLGHTEFVTKLQITNNLLFSAGGDGKIIVWDFFAGEKITEINTNDYLNEKKVLEQFTQTMDKESVEVSVLPIVDLQMHQLNNDIILIVQLYNCTELQLYKLNMETKTINYFKTLADIPQPFRFALLPNRLLILNDVNISTYTVPEFNQKNNELLTLFYNKNKNQLQNSDNNSSITMLYKRKFDNVKEYLERKKIRLDGHQ